MAHFKKMARLFGQNWAICINENLPNRKKFQIRSIFCEKLDKPFKFFLTSNFSPNLVTCFYESYHCSSTFDHTAI